MSSADFKQTIVLTLGKGNDLTAIENQREELGWERTGR